MLKNRTRPCLNYQMGGCLGPCCLDVNRSVYDEIVREVVLFLKGPDAGSHSKDPAGDDDRR